MMQKSRPDFLKPYDQILIPDERNLYSFSDANKALQAHYSLISGVTLSEHVPHDIKVQFETAKNMFLYSFFAYRLAMPAVHQVVAATELGLRIFLGDPKAHWKENTLKPLLQKAQDKGILDTQKIRPNLDIEKLKKFLGDFRNHLSHGSHTLLQPPALIGIFKDCGAILDQLFEYIAANNLKPSWDAWH